MTEAPNGDGRDGELSSRTDVWDSLPNPGGRMPLWAPLPGLPVFLLAEGDLGLNPIFH